MRVLAIDPGERVGWATALTSPDPPDQLLLEKHGISGLKEFALKLGDSIHNYDVVIFENYRLIKAKSRDGEELQTSQLIGMIRYLAWLHPNVTLVSQSPKIKKTADKSAQGDFKDLIERESSVHDDAHDIDAIRHLWYWWWKRQMKEATDGKQA